jgi:beta-glucosidase
MNPALRPAARTELLLQAMTLDQKIAQMQTIPSRNAELRGCGFQPLGRHVEGIRELGIPTLRAINGGTGVRGGDCLPEPTATALPSAPLGAATFSPSVNFAWGAVLGDEVRDFAHHVMLGPGLNLIRHPYSGRAQEYMSEDPYLAGVTATQQVRGIQSRDTHAMIKHFVTNDDEGGQLERWTKATRVPARAMHELYLLPFEMAIRTGKAASVMCAFPHLNGDWACENQELMVTTLRHRWGFDGYVESDRRAVHSTVGSILAGMSIELDREPEFYTFDKIKAALAANEITEADIDQVLRGRYLKMFEFGFFDEPRNKFVPTDLTGHAAVARRAAEQGIVLLKNERNFLPLQPAVRSIALIGAQWFAGMATLPPRNGNPAELTTVIPPFTVTPEQGLKATLKKLGSAATVTYNNGSNITSAVALARKSDVVIVMVGTTPRETRDLPRLTLPVVPATDPPPDKCDAEEEEEEPSRCPQTPASAFTDQNALVAAIAAANPNTVVVLKTAGMVLMPWLKSVPALLEAWFPGEHDGDVVADILFGVISPSGKLPVTFGNTAREAAFATQAQYPGVRENNGLPGGQGPAGSGRPQLVGHYTENLEMGYRWYESNNVTPLFPFGFGLSYTTFAYSDLKVTRTADATSRRVTLTASYTVTNTGPRRGAEASQVYLTLPAEAEEPSKRLVGFEKVDLRPGQSRRVTVTIDESAPNHPLSYFQPDPNGTWADGVWLSPSGSYTVHVGGSSADTPLEQTINVQFPAVRPALHIDTPNTSTVWGVGTTQRLAWTYLGDAATFQIEISRNAGATWSPLAFVNNRPGGSQTFFWTVQGPSTSSARVRVTAFGEPGATDVNDANIRITAPAIEILRPVGSVIAGSRVRIFYQHNLGVGAPVAIDISADNGTTWTPLVETLTNGSTTSSTAWTVGLAPTPRARIRVRALDGSGVAGVSSAFAVTAATARPSAHAFLGEDGRLVYVPYANGDRIPDFSFAGYGGGGVALPTVPTAVTVSPIRGDDGANIQAAIDKVSMREVDANGFRGAVQLTAGTYDVAGNLHIRVSGVVLRGQGQDANGTVIRAAGKSRRVLITVAGIANRTEIAGTRQLITDEYVPVGAFRLTVLNASSFAVGDDVIVTRTPNQAWIDAIGMDACNSRGTPYDTSDVSGRTCLGGAGVVPWTPASRVIRYERHITSVDGNQITIDAPTVEAIQQEFGGGYVARYQFPGRISHVGIESLRAESDYASAADERHATRMIAFANVRDAWVRNVTAQFFEQGTVAVRGGSAYVTIQDSASLDPKSRITGGRRYAFSLEGGSFVLVMRSVATAGRHDYVTGANSPGPNVFLDDAALRSYSELGPHHRWATGTLYDRVRHESIGRDEIIGVYNRGNSGTGHGWSGAYQVFWNCVGDVHRVASPPYAHNWSVGCRARRRQGNGEFEAFGTPVTPSSLYLQQLRDRLGESAVVNIGYRTAQPVTRLFGGRYRPEPGRTADTGEEASASMNVDSPSALTAQALNRRRYRPAARRPARQPQTTDPFSQSIPV